MFDKSRHKIELKTFSLYALVLTVTRGGHSTGMFSCPHIPYQLHFQCHLMLETLFFLILLHAVVLDMQQLRDVSVKEERVRYLGKGYVLLLHLQTGFSYPLTQNAILSGKGLVVKTCNTPRSRKCLHISLNCKI